MEWEELPDLPNQLGVAGPFVGVHNDALILGGRANFPLGVPGKKRVMDSILPNFIRIKFMYWSKMENHITGAIILLN